MNLFLYVIIFIIGAFFGSFFTLAVYRIPRKEDILIKHSYCPNCNQKLGFFDLFPIFSYLFLKGKCRYCSNKIRPRYLILELLSGITFVIIALSLNIKNLNLYDIINLSAQLVYISILFIIAGIDKENLNIQKGPIIVGYVMELIYIIYQCTLGNVNVYQYVIYFIILIFILLLSNITLKMFMNEKYYIKILYLFLYIIVFCGSKLYVLTAILTLLVISIYKLLSKKKQIKKLPVGFYISVSNIVVLIMTNIITNYMI